MLGAIKKWFAEYFNVSHDPKITISGTISPVESSNCILCGRLTTQSFTFSKESYNTCYREIGGDGTECVTHECTIRNRKLSISMDYGYSPDGYQSAKFGNWSSNAGMWILKTENKCQITLYVVVDENDPVTTRLTYHDFKTKTLEEIFLYAKTELEKMQMLL